MHGLNDNGTFDNPTVFNLKNTVWTSNGRKESGLQMVMISNGIWNPEAQTFEIRTNSRHFVKNHKKSRQKCPDFEWSVFSSYPKEAKQLLNGCWLVPPSKCRQNKDRLREWGSECSIVRENCVTGSVATEQSGFQMVGNRAIAIGFSFMHSVF